MTLNTRLSMDINLRRRAILTGLRPFLDDEELQAALSLWQQDYATQPVFALSGLVAQCCSRPELKRQRSQILRALIAAMSLPHDQLLPDNPALYSASSSVSSATLSNSPDMGSLPPAKPQLAGADDKTRSFMALMDNLLASCEPELQAAMRQQLQASLDNLGLARAQKNAMWAWLSGQGAAKEEAQGKSAELGQAYALKPLQALINQAYIVMCEHLGPVKADQHLSRAVNATQGKQAHSANDSFSVHELL